MRPFRCPYHTTFHTSSYNSYHELHLHDEPSFHDMAYNMDYLNMLNQPINVFTVNAPPEKKTENFLTREQARAKEIKEKEELRLWWDDLPEEKRQEVRDEQFVEKKKKKPEEKKKPSKPKRGSSDNEEESKYAFIHNGVDRRPAKPDMKGMLMTQHWANMRM